MRRANCLIINELKLMVANIKDDARTWCHLIASGANQLHIYSDTSALIFQLQNELHCGDNPKTTRCNQKRLNYQRQRLAKIISILRHILEALRFIQERTEHMWQRVRLWKDDASLQHYRITRQLTTTKLHELLQFLNKRYEYEWEVKEMVVLELDNEYVEYNVNILLAAWRSNRHAGGSDFNDKLKEFYWSLGLRQCPDFSNIL